MALARGSRGDCYVCLSANSIVNKQLYKEYKNNPDYKDVKINAKGGMKATHIGHNKAEKMTSENYAKIVCKIGFITTDTLASYCPKI